MGPLGRNRSSLWLFLAFGVGALANRWLSNRDDVGEGSSSLADHPQSDLLLAVSSASPVVLPDMPAALFEQKSRFTLVIDSQHEPDAALANNIVAPIQASSAYIANPNSSDNNDETVIEWSQSSNSAEALGYRTDTAPHLPDINAESAPQNSASPFAANVISETRLPQSQDVEALQDGPHFDPEPSSLEQEGLDDDRFVSITYLNEQMGPPAPEEEDDDEYFDTLSEGEVEPPEEGMEQYEINPGEDGDSEGE